MPYVQGQTIHDADSHIMESPDFLDRYLEAAYRDRVDVRKWFGGPTNLLRDSMNSLRRRHDDPGWRAESAEKIRLRKNYDAMGSWRRADRPTALDRLGFSSQLVFTTWFLGLMDLEYRDDPGLTHAVARDAIELGAKGLLIPSRCPRGHSPSHVEFDPLWATAQEAGLPILFHVGGGGQLLSPDYFKNGLPPVPDFH